MIKNTKGGHMNTRYLQEAPPIIKEFLTYTQTVQGRSALTVDEYYLDLRTFFRYTLRERKMISLNTEFEDIDISCVDLELVRTITFSDIVSFINYCANERHNQIISRNRKGTSLKQYFKYLTDITGQIEKNPTANLKTPTKKKKLPKHLTLEQSLQLLQAVDGNNKERDYCILILFLNCGMRLSELVGINLGDINDERILRLRGKGNKERTIYLNDACIKAIESYKKVRPVDGVKDKNVVKVVFNDMDKNIPGKALYFSRSPIPSGAAFFYSHVGIYAYRYDALKKFVEFPQTFLEKSESLEQLRAIQNDMNVWAVPVKKGAISVDVREDLQAVLKALSQYCYSYSTPNRCGTNITS